MRRPSQQPAANPARNQAAELPETRERRGRFIRECLIENDPLCGSVIYLTRRANCWLDLHLLEEVQEAAAHFEFFRAALDQHEVTAADVARHAFDGVDVDERGAVDLPEQRRIELFGQV